MKNATPGKIIIKMKHVDNQERLTKFLKRVSDYGQYGGDLILKIDNDTKDGEVFCIGHDVTIRKITSEYELE